ncbi:hypothetical protein C0J52_13189 [Blattella germanica]|nr:hypothetical protein C0J52_13189 [Blattella germanica]
MFIQSESGGKCSAKHVIAERSKTHDLIGPPDPVSNLRPIIFHIPKNELPIETKFRNEREKIQKWNEEFWTKHNLRFIKERKQYIKDIAGPNERTLTADEMSVFYKTFLDKNWNVHLKYNMEWYRRNVGLAVLALRVKLIKFKNDLSKRNSFVAPR